MKLLSLLIWLSLSTGVVTANAEDPRVMLHPVTVGPVTANKSTFSFELMDNDTGFTVSDRDLNISHEKKLHFLIYDPSLKEFQHVHPDYDGKSWNVEVNFTVSGNYWLWAQGELIDGTEFSSSERLDVQVSNPAWPTPAVLNDTRSNSDGVSVVTLENKKLRAGKMAMLMVELSRNDGTDAKPAPYLGAFAHVVSVYEDAATLTHVHPMDTANPREGMLHVTFPYAGKYRLWVQYMDDEILRVVPLAVEVFK